MIAYEKKRAQYDVFLKSICEFYCNSDMLNAFLLVVSIFSASLKSVYLQCNNRTNTQMKGFHKRG